MRLSQTIHRSFGRNVLRAKKQSPHIFFAAGVIGVAGSTVLACRATLKLEATLDDIKADIEKVKVTERLTEQEKSRVLMIKYARGVGKLGKLYGPTIILGTASISALAGSHVQMTRRNSALTATLALVTQAYDDYRIRVREELGEERELEIYRAIREEEVEIDGKKQMVQVGDPNRHSPYARCFDEASSEWQKSAEFNRIFIQCQQNYLNHVLQARGHVFLNEVYDALGLERSRAGAVVGWLSDGVGDGYIDFGIFEVHNARFINNQERSVWLDFNVDGTIHDKI